MIKQNFSTGKNSIPILSAGQIDYFAKAVIEDFDSAQLKSPQPFDVDRFIELYLGMERDYQYLSHNKAILGMTAFRAGYITVYDQESGGIKDIYVNEGTALLDLSLLESGQEHRERFTATHEGCHWVLHKEVFQNINHSIYGTANRVACKVADIEQNRKRKLESDRDWIEWQADYLASALLMPVDAVRIAFLKMCREAGIRKPVILLGQDDDFDVFAETLLPEMLSDLFCVSKKSASIRLRKLGLVKNPDVCS